VGRGVAQPKNAMEGAILLTGTEAFNSKQGLVEVIIFFSLHFLTHGNISFLGWRARHLTALLLILQTIFFLLVFWSIGTSHHTVVLHLASAGIHTLFSLAGIALAVCAASTLRRGVSEQRAGAVKIKNGQAKFALFLFLTLALTALGIDERLEETDFSIGVYRSLIVFLAASTTLYFFARTLVAPLENSAVVIQLLGRQFWCWIGTCALLFAPHLVAPPFHSYLVTALAWLLAAAIHCVAAAAAAAARHRSCCAHCTG
jgi:hypothetical protein